MSESTQEWGDDILQVDTIDPEAAARDADEAEPDGLKRTTAGQQDRESPPPGSERADDGPSQQSRETRVFPDSRQRQHDR